uniref:Putative secreted protein n=1 Tax=Anopheles darlingi TaxID=43151 RepID=A0A2M4DJ63_ANODA
MASLAESSSFICSVLSISVFHPSVSDEEDNNSFNTIFDCFKLDSRSNASCKSDRYSGMSTRGSNGWDLLQSFDVPVRLARNCCTICASAAESCSSSFT